MSAHLDSAPDELSDIEQLLAGYRPLPGTIDEMMDEQGRPRAHWRPLLAMLGALGPEEITRRFAAADRYLHDSGVFYRVYEDPAGAERPWPLSHVPLLIDHGEWTALKAGLVQRAEVVEAVLADIYGDATLVREGRLPAALIAGNPEFLRPLVGVAPPGGAYLRSYAVDVGRGTDGRWWVLGDRTQAPSGAGYTLENRLALSRAIPDIYRGAKVERLAPYFKGLQADLSTFSRRDNSPVCLLTPGPMNETYFEHAYLARYLGMLLVEGEDLTVRDDGVFIRTVSGLKRAEVLLRRLDSDFADPLELNAASRLGVQRPRPGGARRQGGDRQCAWNRCRRSACAARLPAGAGAGRGGRDLILPNVATWWLGQSDVRDAMIGELDSMVIAPAFGDHLADAVGEGTLGEQLDHDRRARIVRAISDRGVDFVVQEAVTLSTMPTWHDGRLEPRPFILRLFLARTGDKWSVMPGGFVRIADNADARAVSLQRGGKTADAWMLSEGPVVETTLLPTPEHISIRRATGVLPSRAADNLFWVGRYVERAEATLRLVRALLHRMTDSDDGAASLIGRIDDLLEAWSASSSDIPGSKAGLVARAALRGDFDGSLPNLVRSAHAAASVIRDQFSPDAWRALNDLVAVIVARLPTGPSEDLMLERVERALRIISSFSGLAQENMTRLAGWRFLELGRRIERAIATCRFIEQFAGVPGRMPRSMSCSNCATARSPTGSATL